MTALAGLALMGSGSTPESGPYSKQVSKAMLYLLKAAEASNDGLIAAGDMEGQSMYGHGFSMLFLAQCYGMDISPEYGERLKKVLEKAVLVTAKAQSDLGKQRNNAGGWTYTPNSGDEGSVTVTQLQALRACRNVGIKVPESTIDRAVAYLKYCQNADGGINYSASDRGSSRPAISAAAVACFYAAGKYDPARGGEGEEAQMVDKLIKYVLKTVQSGNANDVHSFYTHFYMAQAMYQRGGADWQKYYPQTKTWLLSSQSPDGSWNGDGVGTTYGTALACVILQLPYGYLPIYER
jgi:prenyltransferase beta subunit